MENAGLEHNLTRCASLYDTLREMKRTKEPIPALDGPDLFYFPRMLLRIVMLVVMLQGWAIVISYLVAFFLI